MLEAETTMLTDTQLHLRRLAFLTRGMPIPPGGLIGTRTDADDILWPILLVPVTSEGWLEVERAAYAGTLPPATPESLQES